MTAELGADVAILHMPGMYDQLDNVPDVWEQVWRSFDELVPVIRATGVRIAIENGPIRHIANILIRYGPDEFGMCYDCGHGNCIPDGLEQLDDLRERLISVHLHDNDGKGDLHNPLFSGTMDWEKLAAIMARSAYAKCVSMEVTMPNSGIEDEREFLATAFETGTRLTQMIASRK